MELLSTDQLALHKKNAPPAEPRGALPYPKKNLPDANGLFNQLVLYRFHIVFCL